MINDEIFINFVESVLNECQNLKLLNLAFNLITLKGIKALNDMAHSIKTNGKAALFVSIFLFTVIKLKLLIYEILLAVRKFIPEWKRYWLLE